ncbi:MAG: serine hydrolase domain-containing protein [Chitinophagaceae bacterium]
MLITKRIVLLLVSIFLQQAVVAQKNAIPSSATNYSKEVEERIRQVEKDFFVKFAVKGQQLPTLQDQMAAFHVNGLTIAVINDYKVEWAKGYGWANVEEKKPVTPATLFEPGSISKSLNALGVLKLVQDKKIDLQSDINRFLRSWQFPYDTVSHGKKISVANLLSHTAGLTVHGFPGYYYGDTLPTIVQILDGSGPANTAPVRSMFEPGLRHEYSGGGTMISELIQVDVSGKPYDQYIEETVFQPLGMSNSFFTQPPPASKKDLLATAYGGDGVPIKGNHPILIEQAAGGLWTTPSDLAKFVIEMQLSAQGRSNKILTKETTQLMLTPYIDEHAALGVFIDKRNGTNYFQHTAGNQGFGGIYYASLEEGKAIIAFINSDAGFAVLTQLMNSVANVYNWKGMASPVKPIVKETIELTAATASSYTGLYREQKGAMAVITQKDGALWYRAGRGGEWKMYFNSPTTYFNLESTTEKQFYTSTGDKIAGYSRSLDGKELAKVEKVNVIQVADDLLRQYTGTYQSASDSSKANVVIRDKSLWLEADGEKKKIYFTSTTQFYVAEDEGVDYTVVTAADGKVTGIIGKKNEQSWFFRKTK